MSHFAGTTGLVMNEPLLWEKGKKGRCGISIPTPDVATAPLDDEFTRDEIDFPDLSEVDVARHFTRLSVWNFGVDTGMYPLGSCTMKYNPKTNERQAALPGFAGAHPMLPPELSQGDPAADVRTGAVPLGDNGHARHHPAAGSRRTRRIDRHAPILCLSQE